MVPDAVREDVLKANDRGHGGAPSEAEGPGAIATFKPVADGCDPLKEGEPAGQWDVFAEGNESPLPVGRWHGAIGASQEGCVVAGHGGSISGPAFPGHGIVGPQNPVRPVLPEQCHHASVVGVRETKGSFGPEEYLGLQRQRLTGQALNLGKGAPLFVGIPLKGLRHRGLNETQADGLGVGLALQTAVAHDFPEPPAHDHQCHQQRQSGFRSPVPARFRTQAHAEEGSSQS